MAGLLELNFAEYNLTQDFIKIVPAKDLICVCCLAENGSFVCLSNCKHWDILLKIVDFTMVEMDIQRKLICSKCHQMLHKVDLFKQQVEESFSILIDKADKITRHQTKKITLQYSNMEQSFTINSQPLEFEIKSESMMTRNVMTTEVKIEPQSDDEDCDMSESIPLSDVKREITIKNEFIRKEKKRKEALKKSLVMPRKYDGKIKVVALTYDEMLAERESDRRRERYSMLPYKCESCIVAFDHENTLLEHNAKRHAKKRGDFTCGICKSVLRTDMSYKEHSRRHFRRYECEVCGKRNSTQPAILEHYGLCHGGGSMENNVKCEICGHVALCNRALRYHRDKHHREKSICTECGKQFVNSAGLKVHMYTVHKMSSRVYRCTSCNRVYSSKSGLNSHVTSRHTSKKMEDTFCADCGTHFRTPANLRHHLRVHSRHVKEEDRKYVCGECGAKFVSKCNLKRHVDYAHLKIVRYECDSCSKSFSNKRGLKKHKSFVHDKWRPPRNKMCDHCGRGFTSLQILRTHIRTHTGERPLQCPHCDATFAHGAALYTHKKYIHSQSRATNQEAPAMDQEVC